MNVKFFSGLPSEDLEAEINTWLVAVNPTVLHIKQSQCYESPADDDGREDMNITITVWYQV